MKEMLWQCLPEGGTVTSLYKEFLRQRTVATNQKLMAGVLIALIYVHGLDLTVGDAGAVLGERGRGEHRWNTPQRITQEQRGRGTHCFTEVWVIRNEAKEKTSELWRHSRGLVSEVKSRDWITAMITEEEQGVRTDRCVQTEQTESCIHTWLNMLNVRHAPIWFEILGANILFRHSCLCCCSIRLQHRNWSQSYRYLHWH